MEYSSIQKEKQDEKDKQDKELLVRTKRYGAKELHMNLTTKKKLTEKLKNILSKKYNLDENDYIILIDKFKLDNEKITKSTIEELISYLNISLQFTQEDDLEKSMENLQKNNKIADSVQQVNIHTEIPHTTIIENKVIKQKITTPALILNLLDNFDVMTFEGTYTMSLNSEIDIDKITIEDIIISNNIIEKYNLSSQPYILIKIRELENNIFMNTSKKYYFSLFKIKNNELKIHELNSSTVNKIFKNSTINISFYDFNEELIKIIDFTNDDYFKIILNLN